MRPVLVCLLPLPVGRRGEGIPEDVTALIALLLLVGARARVSRPWRPTLVLGQFLAVVHSKPSSELCTRRTILANCLPVMTNCPAEFGDMNRAPAGVQT